MHQKPKLSPLLRRCYKNWRAILLLTFFFFLSAVVAIELRRLYFSQCAYHNTISEIKLIKETTTQENLQQLTAATQAYATSLNTLSDCLAKYQIVLPKEAAQESSLSFQEKLQQDVLSIQEEARKENVTLPRSFFLGLNNASEFLSLKKSLQLLLKEEYLLNWVTHIILKEENLVLNDFTFEEETSSTNLINNLSIFSLGYLTFSITSNESSFQKIFNNIIDGPYFIIIKKLAVENSCKKAPLHTQDNTQKSNIKILFGREKITTTITLQLFDISITNVPF